MITRRDLAKELADRGLAEWVVIERAQELASLDEHARVHRREQRVLWQLTVHVDTPAGRGSSHVAIDAVDGTAAAVVEQAVAAARASVGPAWISRPLAAPARVKLEDAALASRDLGDAVRDLVAKLPRPVGIAARASLLRERVDVVARQGFHTEWIATLARVDALAIAGRRSLVIVREARQLAGLELAAALDDAKRDLELLQSAGPPTAGPCTLVLRADAMLHDGLGVWAAFASQADAVVERQGLTRYRERTPIAPGAHQIAEPLTIRSNGALDFGVRSAPLGDHGDAVRIFTLVERGTAADLALSPREGALRGRDPNGGVRNLEVSTGSWSGTLAGIAPRVVEVRRLRSLAIDPYTGEASLAIALGIDHSSGAPKPFRGGSFRIDLIAALARARRSATTITRGAYKGPDAVLVERADLLG